MEIKDIGFKREDDRNNAVTPLPDNNPLPTPKVHIDSTVEPTQLQQRKPDLVDLLRDGLTPFDVNNIFTRSKLDGGIPSNLSVTGTDIPLTFEQASLLSSGYSAADLTAEYMKRRNPLIIPEPVSKVRAVISNLQLAAETYAYNIDVGRNKFSQGLIPNAESSFDKFIRERRIQKLMGEAGQINSDVITNISSVVGSMYGVIREGFLHSKGRAVFTTAAALATRGAALPFIFGQDIFFSQVGSVWQDAYDRALNDGCRRYRQLS
jgi:hypothetical protein